MTADCTETLWSRSFAIHIKRATPILVHFVAVFTNAQWLASKVKAHLRVPCVQAEFLRSLFDLDAMPSFIKLDVPAAQREIRLVRANEVIDWHCCGVVSLDC